MRARASSMPQLLISIKARIVPSSQKLYLPVSSVRRSAKVLKERSSSSGGANNNGCPANITRSNVLPERGGERIKMAGGFLATGDGCMGAAPINSLACVIIAAGTLDDVSAS